MKPLESSTAIDRIGANYFDEISVRFPVQGSSDEFHYFPQTPTLEAMLGEWDDLSEASTAAFIGKLRTWEAELRALDGEGIGFEDRADLNYVTLSELAASGTCSGDWGAAARSGLGPGSWQRASLISRTSRPLWLTRPGPEL